jgi:cytochrome c oxidase cbb3-type subunit I/II
MSDDNNAPYYWHRKLEGNLGLFAVLTTVVILIGALVEIIPMFTVTAGPQALAGVTPYTPLEQAGRDIYVREGCYTCHSQMVRPTRAELLRYGDWSRAGEFEYEHPFQLGSRRLGPDLHRVGGKYPDAWHYEHMRNPRSTSPGSVMPTYGWLYTQTLDPADVTASIKALRTVGVPYSDADVAGVAEQLKAQGGQIVQSLASTGIKASPDHEIIAVIAYLQKLGVQGRAAIKAQAAAQAASAQ